MITPVLASFWPCHLETRFNRPLEPPTNFGEEAPSVAGPGTLWAMAFGEWVLLQPERTNGFAIFRAVLYLA